MTTDAYVRASPKILVVDDEEVARENLRELLDSRGFVPTVAADGEEALERASEQDFEVALMDIKMPRMSGMVALPKLREQCPDTFVIMTTGVVDVDMAMEAVRLGAHDYLVKPLNFDTVINTIKNVLTQRDQWLRERQFQSELLRRVKDLNEQSAGDFAELVRALGREHALLFSTNETTIVGRERILPSLPPELQRPLGPAEEFKEALLRILGRTQL